MAPRAGAAGGRGGFLRNEIIWHKPSGTPESVRDRLNPPARAPVPAHPQPVVLVDLDAIRDENGSNPGDVWRVPVRPSKASHFAMYPVDLPQRCIAASSRPQDIVLDPFSGMTTTGSARLDRPRLLEPSSPPRGSTPPAANSPTPSARSRRWPMCACPGSS
nr:site-specific DNA-methyltransferase [Rhodococcus zopfii]